MRLTRRRRRRFIRSLVGGAATVALVASTVAATSVGAQAAPEDTDKIKPQLAEDLEEKGEAPFWIRFATKANLSKARQVKDWDKRGRAVYRLLTTTAQQSQTAVRQELTREGVEFQSFHATNAIKVTAGSQELAERLASRDDVEALYPKRDYDLIEPVDGDGDAVRGANAVEWGIDNINADDVWDTYGVQGEGITVANIDTGVQYDHPALVDEYRGNNGDGTVDHDYNWFDAAGACGDAPCDTNGHGTHTMGTMMGDDGGENQVGVAPGANWIAANGCCPSDAALIASGEWMLAPTDADGENPDPSMRPHIVNNSWGTTVPSNDPFMEDILEAWDAAGIFGAWSNGNNGPSCETSGSPGSRTLNYSAGAYDVNDTIAGFSSRGPGQDGEIKPNISAPGVNVRSSVPGNGYGNFSGTSMAAPHLAGAVALLWSGAPSLVGEIDDTKELLDQSATDTEDLSCGGTAEDNNVYGEGRLDALALLDAAPVGDTGTLEGTVTEAGSGDPIEDATVTVTGEIDREVTTEEDGTYSVTLTSGDYTVEAFKFGFGDESAEVTVPVNETVTQDFALEEAPSVSVNGQVLDGSGHGWPLYAKVSVEGADASTYTHPGNGRYRLSLPANSTYELTFEAQYDGYETVTETVEVGDSNVRRNVDVPVDADHCIAPGYEYTYDGATEDFNGGELPQGWTVVDNAGTDQVWQFDNPAGRENMTGGDGEFAIIDSDNYGSSGQQDTSLVSPVVDLSDVDSPAVGFKQDFNYLFGELADVDVSVDGGDTWENVLSQTSDARGPDEQFIQLPMAANQPAVQVRFHYYEADWDWWWQVDDVFIGNRACEPIPGGLVYGHVRDHNNQQMINGAVVTSVDAPEDTATTRATPDDDNRQDGFYAMFSSLTGEQVFEASAGNYRTTRQSADVAPDWATRRNFALAAAQLSVEPEELKATLQLDGGTADREFTVTNDGGEPAELEFSESGGDFELLRADGTRMTRKQITNAEGAPLQENKAPVSFANHAKSRMGTQDKSPANGPTDEPWVDLADYPNNVMDNRVVQLDGKIYSVGGSTGSASTSAVYVYDPATLDWQAVADLPDARNAMTVGVVDGQIVASGGWGPSGPDAATWVYDPAADAWTEAADNPAARSAAGQAVLDGKLYAVGGCTTAACTPMDDAVVAYDLGSDSWETLAEYPESVAFASCGAIEGLLYCTGGTNGSSATAASYVYDPGTDSWSQIADAPADTWASAYAVANGQLLVNGGVQGGLISNAGFAYDPASDSWSDLPNSNTARYRGAASCGFYKVGGSSGGFSATPDSEVLPGYAECAVGGADVEWMSIDTTEASLDPGESVTVTVTMDSDVAQPGTYSAGVRIKEDTPYSVDPVDVTMEITPPDTWGKLAGTVEGVSCDTGTAPISGATVQVDSWVLDWTFSTDENGQYAHWMDHRNNTLEIIAAKDGYKPEFTTRDLLPGETVTADFALEEVGC